MFLKLFRLKAKPLVWEPGALYFIKPDGATFTDTYITGSDAVPLPITNPATSLTAYVHTQSVESDLWIVNHNFAREPAAVSVLTTGGVEVLAEWKHLNNNQIEVRFAQPTVGRVIVQ